MLIKMIISCNYLCTMWLKLKRLTTPNIDEQPEFLPLLEEMKMVQPLWKTDIPPTKLPSNVPPRYVPKRNDNMCLYKDLNINVYNSCNIIAPNWKEPKCLAMAEWINTHGACVWWNTSQQWKRTNSTAWEVLEQPNIIYSKTKIRSGLAGTEGGGN